MDKHFFMLSAVAIPHLHLVEKVKSCFLNPGKYFRRERLLLQNCLPSTASSSPQISESDFQVLEQFVVRLYISTINTCEVNLARRILFAKG